MSSSRGFIVEVFSKSQDQSVQFPENEWISETPPYNFCQCSLLRRQRASACPADLRRPSKFLKSPAGKFDDHIISPRRVFFQRSFPPIGNFIQCQSAASLARYKAIGKPVALEARAEDRDVRGLISMTTTRPSLGSWANWMFVPPITPMASTIL